MSIEGLDEADYYEYVIGNAKQFDGGSVIKGTSASKIFSIQNTATSGNVTVSIRPHIGIQAVSVPISATITAGSPTTATTDVPLLTVPILHNTISGTLTKVSNTEVTISGMKSPAHSSGASINYPYSPLTGDTLIDVNGNEFIINNL